MNSLHILSSDGSAEFNPNPTTLNDGLLDEIERRAIDAGCTLHLRSDNSEPGETNCHLESSRDSTLYRPEQRK